MTNSDKFTPVVEDMEFDNIPCYGLPKSVLVSNGKPVVSKEYDSRYYYPLISSYLIKTVETDYQDDSSYVYKCSVCGESVTNPKTANYCSHCGAKIDKNIT